MLENNVLVNWFNTNSGFVSVLIFLITLLLGWITGIFSSLRRKPKFSIEVIPGPSLSSTYFTGNKFNEFDAHITAISLYLKITNIGSAPSSIDKVKVGYHWNINKFNLIWIKYRLGWSWIIPTIINNDFMINVDKDNAKVFPFLFQRSILLNTQTDTYLNIGQNAIGMVYFEQQESWGGAFPIKNKETTKIKVVISDSFGHNHSLITTIPVVEINEARKFNENFGCTYPSINKINESEID